jgi:hypothetical protein
VIAFTAIFFFDGFDNAIVEVERYTVYRVKLLFPKAR